MGKRSIPLSKAFQRLMWTEMANDPKWAYAMDEGVEKLPPGESWPVEKGSSNKRCTD